MYGGISMDSRGRLATDRPMSARDENGGPHDVTRCNMRAVTIAILLASAPETRNRWQAHGAVRWPDTCLNSRRALSGLLQFD
jgi:hypothetical protein